MRRLWTALALFGVVGCGAVLGAFSIDDGPATTDGGASEAATEAGAEDAEQPPSDSGGEAAPPVDAAVREASPYLDAGLWDAGPACGDAAYCVPAAPPGWTGPVLLFQGALKDLSPACPDPGLPGRFNGSGSFFGPTACTPCGCTPTSQLRCAAVVQLFDASACVNLVNTSVDLVPGQGATCHSLGALPASASYKVAFQPATAQGSPTCSPGGTAPLGGGFGAVAETCGALAAGPGACVSGRLCVQAPSGGFVRNMYCVEQVGDVACPGEPYTERHVYYTDKTDTRTCTPCGCGTYDGGTCGPGTVHVNAYAANGCPGAAQPLDPSACGVLPVDGGTWSATVSGVPEVLEAGTCPPSGGVASGYAAPLNATTVCCTP
jgi:hypothetical protein